MASVGDLNFAFNLFSTMAFAFKLGKTGVDEEGLRYLDWVSLMGIIRLRVSRSLLALFGLKEVADMERSAIAFLALARLPPLGIIALEIGERNESVGLEYRLKWDPLPPRIGLALSSS